MGGERIEMGSLFDGKPEAKRWEITWRKMPF
jgi:hypothetical protein